MTMFVVKDIRPLGIGQPYPTFTDVIHVPSAHGDTSSLIHDGIINPNNKQRFKLLTKSHHTFNRGQAGDVYRVKEFLKFGKTYPTSSSFFDCNGITSGLYENIKSNAILVFLVFTGDADCGCRLKLVSTLKH